MRPLGAGPNDEVRAGRTDEVPAGRTDRVPAGRTDEARVGRKTGPLALASAGALLGVGLAVGLVVWALSPGPGPALAESAPLRTTPTPTGADLERAAPEPEPAPVVTPPTPPEAEPTALACAARDRAAAIVDGVPLAVGDLCDALARVAGPGADKDPTVRQRFGPALLDRMIDDRLVARHADRLGVAVPTDELDAEVSRLVRERGAIDSPSLRADVRTHLLRLAVVRRDVTAPTQAEVEAAYAARPDIWAAVDDDGARAIRPFAVVESDVRRSITLERERRAETALLAKLRTDAKVKHLVAW